ncbi:MULTISPECIES: DinB family protein [Spirosoma]|uniref:DinB family protein n=1 Tax=Spirosoma liriopis TaxID=2937440 RepID=A0ABT0HED8_9BACT|nr:MULTISPECIES: DinB family protein [Spirosoma]MCK8490528.1 DinB family protein [Spirosoma liriopis]UHG89896.1 DinB family protein [Spirosoma oryzicola]
MKQSLLHRLASQPDALNHLLFGLTEQQIRQRPPSGKWSIFENIAHLGRYQEIFVDRLHRINSEEAPLFNRYVADEDPGFSGWTQLSVDELLERLRGERATLNAFLSILPEEQLLRVGQHPASGMMTVEGWTELFLLHEAHHFFTVLQLGGALRTADQPMGLYPLPAQ